MPVRFEHDIRDDLDELEEMHGLERSTSGEGVLFMGDEVLVEALDIQVIDVGDGSGRVVCTLRVETPCFQAEMLAREISSYGMGFRVTDHRDPEQELKIHCMEGYR